MQLIQEQLGNYFVIKTIGKLDATWADYFAETCLDLIRNGHHNLIVDAAEMSFLSSAGIRSLLRINKELFSVKGSFLIVHAQDFVVKTIEMTGFRHWISKEFPKELKALKSDKTLASVQVDEGVFELNPSGCLTLSVVADWEPWNTVRTENISKLHFPPSVFALGIGSATESPVEARSSFGEFVAVGGHVVFQVPEAKSRPDYLLAEKEFIPEMHVIQALYCKGEMSHLFRFSPDESKSYFGISDITEKVLSVTGHDAAAFVVLAEVDGLVGVNLIQSPGRFNKSGTIPFPDIREWLSFCGERVFSGQQALVFGVVRKPGDSQKNSLLSGLPSKPDVAGHFHAAVFPYQPLQNGKIDLIQNVQKFLSGPPPMALMHLIDDDRPAIGLGQSSFIRGACWCSPIKKTEGLL